MHCYLGNLITIAERFCKISKKSAVTCRFWGLVVVSRPSSSLFFFRKAAHDPPPPDYLISEQEWEQCLLRLQQLHFVLKAKPSSAFCDCLLWLPSQHSRLADEGEMGEKRKEGKKKTLTKKTHYCRPDGNIPHDQTNQSPRWGAGATQPCSNTPFHSLSGTNTWSPINGTPRTWGGGSLEPYWSMPDDFIITHHFIHWRIQTSILITFPRNRSCCAY